MSPHTVTLIDPPAWYSSIMKAVDGLPSDSHPIAGSFALWMWEAHDGRMPTWVPGDVDIWYASDDTSMYQDIVKVTDSSGNLFVDITKRGSSIIEVNLGEDVPTLQFIQRPIFDDDRALPFGFLDQFDLSVAQVAITRINRRTSDIAPDTATGSGSVCHQVHFEFGDADIRSDIANDLCRCFREMTVASTNTKNRITKYTTRGYQVAQGEIHRLTEWNSYYDAPLRGAPTVDWKTFEPERLVFAAQTTRLKNKMSAVRVDYLDPVTEARVPFCWESPRAKVPFGVSTYPPLDVECNFERKFTLPQNLIDKDYKAFLKSVDTCTLHAVLKHQGQWFPGMREKRQVVLEYNQAPIVHESSKGYPPTTRGKCRQKTEVATGADAVIVHHIPVLWFISGQWGASIQVVKAVV